MLVVRQWQPVEGEDRLDVLLDPVRQRAVAALPALQPGGQVPARLGLVVAICSAMPTLKRNSYSRILKLASLYHPLRDN